MDHPEGARETGDGRLGFDRRERLIGRQNQATLRSYGSPLGECRKNACCEGLKSTCVSVIANIA